MNVQRACVDILQYLLPLENQLHANCTCRDDPDSPAQSVCWLFGPKDSVRPRYQLTEVRVIEHVK